MRQQWTKNLNSIQKLAAIFKKTENIRQDRRDTTIFPMAAQAVDAQADIVSPTLALQAIMARDVVRKNTEDPRHTYRMWDMVLEEPLERCSIPFLLFLCNISPFWLPRLAQMESD